MGCTAGLTTQSQRAGRLKLANLRRGQSGKLALCSAKSAATQKGFPDRPFLVAADYMLHDPEPC